MSNSKAVNTCKAQQRLLADNMSVPKTTSMQNTPSTKQSAWEGHRNSKEFMEALTNFMNESWAAVSQIRERSGLNSAYQMSGGELTKRIEEVSNRLQEKYKEVAELEKQKAELLKSYKAPQVHAMRLGPGHTGNYDIPYGGNVTQHSGSSGKRQIQYASRAGDSCDPSCPNSFTGSSRGYQ